MKKLLFAISAMAIILSSCSEEPTANTNLWPLCRQWRGLNLLGAHYR